MHDSMIDCKKAGPQVQRFAKTLSAVFFFLMINWQVHSQIVDIRLNI
jgi:hypothetical protein